MLVSSGLASATNLGEYFKPRVVGSVHREYFGERIAGRYTVRRLVSPTDESRDLSPDEYAIAVERTIEDWHVSQRKNKPIDPPTEPSGKRVRSVRPKERALLMLYPLDGAEAATPEAIPVIGVAISFPASDTAQAIAYTVNNVFTTAGDYDDL